ncbi:hypothetical protein BDQ17DRAFT_1427441 [Cyathus striatus]|nr:hypothetical protein BDQ17DRAFT_1427441 [Cyathus striatus]
MPIITTQQATPKGMQIQPYDQYQLLEKRPTPTYKGLVKRVADGTTDAFTNQKLYLIIVFIGLFVVVILGIMLSAWCCQGMSDFCFLVFSFLFFSFRSHPLVLSLGSLSSFAILYFFAFPASGHDVPSSSLMSSITLRSPLFLSLSSFPPLPRTSPTTIPPPFTVTLPYRLFSHPFKYGANTPPLSRIIRKSPLLSLLPMCMLWWSQ